MKLKIRIKVVKSVAAHRSIRSLWTDNNHRFLCWFSIGIHFHWLIQSECERKIIIVFPLKIPLFQSFCWASMSMLDAMVMAQMVVAFLPTWLFMLSQCWWRGWFGGRVRFQRFTASVQFWTFKHSNKNANKCDKILTMELTCSFLLYLDFVIVACVARPGFGIFSLDCRIFSSHDFSTGLHDLAPDSWTFFDCIGRLRSHTFWPVRGIYSQCPFGSELECVGTVCRKNPT